LVSNVTELDAFTFSILSSVQAAIWVREFGEYFDFFGLSN
jgi:hypothetical protein